MFEVDHCTYARQQNVGYGGMRHAATCRAQGFRVRLIVRAVQRMQDRYLGAGGSCEAVSAYEETNRIHLRSLAGLWIILACATGCAVLLAVLRRYCWAPLPPPPGDKKATGESSAAFVDAQSAAAHGGVAVAYYKPGV